MADFATDAFTGTDGTELSAYSANWVRHSAGSTSGINAQLIGGRVRPSGNGVALYYHSGSPPSADYSVFADVYEASEPTNYGAGVVGRLDTAANTMYHARHVKINAAGKNGWELLKIVAGTQTLLGSYVADDITTGSSAQVELRMTGTTIELYKRGESTPTIAVTDSSITAAGKAGFRTGFNGGQEPSDTTLYLLDNFAAEDTGAAQTIVPSLFINSNTFYVPTVSWAYTISPELYTDSDTFYSATISSSYVIAPTLYVDADTFYAATVGTSGGPQTLLPPLYVDPGTFYVHTVTGGLGSGVGQRTRYITVEFYDSGDVWRTNIARDILEYSAQPSKIAFSYMSPQDTIAYSLSTDKIHYTRGQVMGSIQRRSAFKKVFGAPPTPPFTPLDVGGILRWYDADAIAQDDGTPVASWTDKSPTEDHATQVTLANQPIFKTNILNGKPVVRFDGSNDFLEFGELFDSSSAVAHIIVVAKSSASGTRGIIGTRPISTSAVGWQFRYESASQLLYYHTGQSPNVSLSITNKFNIIEVSRNGLEITLGVDGVLGTPTTISGYSASSLNKTRIGSAGGTAESYFLGDIAEIIIYDHVLSSDDRTDILGHLVAKYNI